MTSQKKLQTRNWNKIWYNIAGNYASERRHCQVIFKQPLGFVTWPVNPGRSMNSHFFSNEELAPDCEAWITRDPREPYMSTASADQTYRRVLQQHESGLRWRFLVTMGIKYLQSEEKETSYRRWHRPEFSILGWRVPKSAATTREHKLWWLTKPYQHSCFPPLKTSARFFHYQT